jgi:hypothetical protein
MYDGLNVFWLGAELEIVVPRIEKAGVQSFWQSFWVN